MYMIRVYIIIIFIYDYPGRIIDKNVSQLKMYISFFFIKFHILFACTIIFKILNIIINL